jgi:hypothetical protein
MVDEAFNEYNYVLKKYTPYYVTGEMARRVFSDIYYNLGLIYHMKGEALKEIEAYKRASYFPHEMTKLIIT